MSDDLNKKIKQVTDALGQDKLPENIVNLLALLANSSAPSGKEENPPKVPDAPSPIEETQVRSGPVPETDMLAKVRRAMDRMGSINDPRINLLTAIKPFMSAGRQKKINNCINLLKISGLTRLLDENGKGIF